MEGAYINSRHIVFWYIWQNSEFPACTVGEIAQFVTVQFALGYTNSDQFTISSKCP